MEFAVWFAGVGGPAVSIPAHDVGMLGLDKIRQHLGFALDPSRVDGAVSGIFSNPRIVLSEQQARSSCRFDQKNEVTVKVAPKSLNRFVVEETRVSRSQDTGEVWSAALAPVVDVAIIDEWLKKGAPLEWNE